jgi:hypothetical protein
VPRIVLLLIALLAGCGGGSDQPTHDLAVTAAVDLEKPRAGAPDAGTAAGHGNDGAIATTGAAVFSFTGAVKPPDSSVSASDGVVRVEPSGRFTVAVASPKSGAKTVRIAAAKAGHREWRTEVRVLRGEPGRVRVPERDAEAPTAALLLEPTPDTPTTVQGSPSRAGEPPDFVTLPAPVLRVTAAVRDAEGGTGRIRLSIVSTTRCGDSKRRKVRHLPPAQVVRIVLPPGTSAPVERERSARLPLDAPRGCSVRGEVFAEGTDAHDRQAVTRHVGFRYP